MNHLLFILNPFWAGIFIIAALIAFFIIRAIIKHNKEEAKEKSDINNITDWDTWNEYKDMPAAKKHPELMENVKERLIKTDLVAIDKMELPEMLHLCERALPFSCLQFEIKQKIKEVIEKKYNLLDEGVKNKSWDTAEYLKQLAQFS